MRHRWLAFAVAMGICAGMSSAAAAGVFHAPRGASATRPAGHSRRTLPPAHQPTPASGAPAVEYDCAAPAGSPALAVEPSSIVVACADDGVGVEDLSWLRWRRAAAQGTGVVWWHVCTPDCASSTTFDRYPATITLSGAVRTPTGPAFTVMSVAYRGTGPRHQPTGTPITRFTLPYPGE